MKNLKITSVFKSIQGEGLFAGMPTTFIRLYTKNCFPNKKRCKFCDTVTQPYFRQWITSDMIFNVNNDIDSELITITGGEPLSVDKEEFMNFIERLYEEFSPEGIEMETNGAYLQEAYFNNDTQFIEFLGENFCNINVSPKLANSGVDFEYKPEVFGYLSNYYNNISFKFVAGKDLKTDFALIDEFVDKGDIINNNVFVMAMTPTTNEHKRQVVEECLKRNYAYSPRLHVDLYGDDCKVDK
jgi:7-carboxy-7-deazaguanine synthase